MEQVRNLGASAAKRPTSPFVETLKSVGPWLIIAGLLLVCDSMTGVIGLFPDLPFSDQSMQVASSVCGQWEIKPSPKMPFMKMLSNVGAFTMLSSSDAWIVGSSQQWDDNTDAYLMALHWNGYRWVNVAVNSPASGHGSVPAYLNLNSVSALGSDDVWAVGSGETNGQTTIRHWDGSSWSITASPVLTSNYNHLYGLAAVAPNDIWAVGHADIPNIIWSSESVLHTALANDANTLIMHWDGTEWTLVPAPEVGGLNAIAAVSANDVWAVGNEIVHWDGSHWEKSDGPDGIFHDLSVVDKESIWAVGENAGEMITAHWDGKSWKEISNSTNGDQGKRELSVLNAVTALASDDVWAVGSQFADGPDADKMFNNNLFTLVEHWDGKAWSLVPSPSTSNRQHFVDVFAASKNEVWALGEDGDSGGVLIEQFTRSNCR